MWFTQEIDNMPPGRPKNGETGGGHSYSSKEAWDWTVRQMRCDFLSQSPAAQEQTLQRVIDLLHAERCRGQRHPSALMRLADKVFGVQL